MNELPKCPCCGADGLRLRDEMTPNGLHYRVECDYCGMVYQHNSFYGFNNVIAFFESTGPGECEDQGGADQFMCSHCGYTHDYTPEELKDPKAFSFCPTCGFEVLR